MITLTRSTAGKKIKIRKMSKASLKTHKITLIFSKEIGHNLGKRRFLSHYFSIETTERDSLIRCFELVKESIIQPRILIPSTLGLQ